MAPLLFFRFPHKSLPLSLLPLLYPDSWHIGAIHGHSHNSRHNSISPLVIPFTLFLHSLSLFHTLSHYFHLSIREPFFKALQMLSLYTHSSHSLTTLKRETTYPVSHFLFCVLSLWTWVCLSMHSTVEKGRRSHSTPSFTHFPINHYSRCSLSLFFFSNFPSCFHFLIFLISLFLLFQMASTHL